MFIPTRAGSPPTFLLRFSILRAACAIVTNSTPDHSRSACRIAVNRKVQGVAVAASCFAGIAPMVTNMRIENVEAFRKEFKEQARKNIPCCLLQYPSNPLPL